MSEAERDATLDRAVEAAAAVIDAASLRVAGVAAANYLRGPRPRFQRVR